METKLNNFLQSNKIFADDYFYSPVTDSYHIILEGDWKHEHWRCDNLVSQFFNSNGYIITNAVEEVIDEDGSDYYTAEHIYSVKSIDK